MSTEAPVETAEETPTPTSARRLLVDWANGQDGWARALVSEVLASRRPVSEEVLDNIYARFLAEKSLGPEPASDVPLLELEEDAGPAADSFVLTKLDAVEGVNALSPGQEIDFNRGLTILFGENGAGKTGYARILKCLAAVRTAEDVLPNVHDAAAQQTPAARVTFEASGEARTLEWRGERGVAPFTHISVFDSPAVGLHVDGDLTYVYTPSDLALFRHVADGLDGVKARAEGEAASKKPSSNPYLTHFERGTPVYAAVETLGPATDLTDLEAMAAVTPEEEQGLSTLRQQVDSLKAGSVQAQLTVARSRRFVHEALTKAAEAALSFDATAYNQAVATARDAKEEYVRVRRMLFASAGIVGEPSDEWQAFVLDGDAYRRHLHDDHYPQHGDPCLYCQQPLGDAAIELLRQYQRFANDASRKRIDDAERLLTTLKQGLAGIKPSDLRASVARQHELDPDDAALSTADKFLAGLEASAGALQASDPVEWTAVGQLAQPVREASEQRVKAADQLVADLTTRAQDRARALADASGRLQALESRLELKRRLADIKTYVALAKWVQRLEQLTRKLPQVKRSLTDTMKVASEQLLNSDFERRFQEESQALRAPSVRLAFPGRDGRAARRKIVSADHLPSAVLSEGEQKVIAMADFLAEAGLRNAPAPVVFDDPVNSLDYRRIHEVADRIARLTGNRQVIVFTHNIWFATELLARFEQAPDLCTYYTVTDDPSAGVVQAGTHPRWDSAKKLKGKINSLIQGAGSADAEMREAAIEKAYDLIRSWCEVVVEQELLAGVTQRYQANVVMTKLPQIKGERLAAATAVIQPIFEKACRIMGGHSQPLETLSVRPTLEELKTDWSALTKALEDYKADAA